MIRPTPRSTRTDSLLPYTTLCVARFEAVLRKQMTAQLTVDGAVEGQGGFRDHSPTSLASAASTNASCVTTLSVVGFQGASGPRRRDQPWNSTPRRAPRSCVRSIDRPEAKASGEIGRAHV